MDMSKRELVIDHPPEEMDNYTPIKIGKSKIKRKAVNFPLCYLHAEWERTNIECLNCDLWSMCATKQSNKES